MNDLQIIELYFRRDEKALQETAIKYGGFCCNMAFNILQSTKMLKNALMTHIYEHGNQFLLKNLIALEAGLLELCETYHLICGEKTIEKNAMRELRCFSTN